MLICRAAATKAPAFGRRCLAAGASLSTCRVSPRWSCSTTICPPLSSPQAGPLRADVPADPAGRLHAAPIAPADLVQRVTDLPQRAMADGFNQDFEHVSAIDRHLPQLRQPGRTLRSIACVEIAQARQLAPLFFLGREAEPVGAPERFPRTQCFAMSCLAGEAAAGGDR